MRQVPKIKYLLIGAGRLSKHLSFYFKTQNITHQIWNRKVNNESDLATMAKDATHVCFLTKDSAIEKFYTDYQEYFEDKVCFHCSGSLIVEGLQSAHPLMTFTEDLYPLETYQKIVFVLEKNKNTFEEVFPNLANKHHYIPSEKKALYHAYLVMSGNFTSILWKSVLSDLQKEFNIGAEDTLPYLNQIFENIKKDPETAPTGPLVRGDKYTMMAHFNAVGDSNYYDLYKAFSVFYEKSQIDETELNWDAFAKQNLNHLTHKDLN